MPEGFGCGDPLETRRISPSSSSLLSQDSSGVSSLMANAVTIAITEPGMDRDRDRDRDGHPGHRLSAMRRSDVMPGTPVSSHHSHHSHYSAGVDVFELDDQGKLSRHEMHVPDIVQLRHKTGLPVRDLRMFFQPKDAAATGGPAHDGPTRQLRDSNPATILVLPTHGSMMIKLEHLKILSTREKCIILNPEDSSVHSFVTQLQELVSAHPASRLRPEESSVHLYLAALSAQAELNFSLVVLETALLTVTNKFWRRLSLLKPMLELLLQETSANPNAGMLRRMLAFRKSLNAFTTSVIAVKAAVNEALKAEQTPFRRRISRLSQDSAELEAEEIELLLGAYFADLKEIEHDLKNIDEQIEDTNDFINIHLNSIRNRIIKMSLFMEAGTLAAGVGAVIAGFFGMNLTNGLEDHPAAFTIVCCAVVVLSSILFGIFVHRYGQIQDKSSSSARSYQAVKYFFTYVDNVDAAVTNDKVQKSVGNRGEFRKLLESVLGPDLPDKEADSIAKLLDIGAADAACGPSATVPIVGETSLEDDPVNRNNLAVDGHPDGGGRAGRGRGLGGAAAGGGDAVGARQGADKGYLNLGLSLQSLFHYS